MVHREIRIPARDGYLLSATLLEPENREPHGLVIVNSATGVPRQFYRRYAEYLRQEGFAVLLFDYRGIGDSRPADLRSFPAKMSDWGIYDIPGVLDWAASECDSLPKLMIGHSVGGQMFGIADNNHTASAMLLIGSQSGEWRLWPGLSKVRLMLVYYAAIPILTHSFGYFPSSKVGMGEDLPPGVALQWAKMGRTKGYIRGAVDPELADLFKNFRGKMLAYSFSDDWYAPRQAVDGLLSYYESADRDHRHLRPQDINVRRIGHFGFFREQFRQTLWRETAEWLKFTAANSGAAEKARISRA
jgi:predicted alpha/beta hydrolase